MEQLAARRAHNPKVGGSSPPPATKGAEQQCSVPVFLASVTRLNVLADNQSRAFRGSLEYRAKSEIPVFQIPTGLFCGTR